jgi:endonuclease/exonuclease/phosphatase family metal-dependent hydrolase
MTFNIRYDDGSDGPNAWSRRRALALETIRAHDPALLGLQEATAVQLADVAAALPDCSTVDRDRVDEGDGDGPVVFYRSNRFDLRDEGRFWLSDTPQEVGSVTWPNDWGPRSCRWARLRDRLADRELVFACTHFDTNAGASMPSAQTIHVELDRIAAAAPVILAGDFNCAAGSVAHEYLRSAAAYRDAWTEAGHADEGVLTFNDFTPSTRFSSDLDGTNGRIDWILLRGPLACVSAVIDVARCGDLLPSDHYPVAALIEWIQPFTSTASGSVVAPARA